MSQYDPTFDLKINVGHCDLYIFHDPVILCNILKTFWCMNIIIWCMNIILRIMSQYDLKINVGLYDLYFMVQWFSVISEKYLMYEHHTFINLG